jgi:serine/threonine-protein kinase RsbW
MPTNFHSPSDSQAIGGKSKSMSDHRWSWTAVRSLPSRPDAHVPLMVEILDELKKLGWDGRDSFGVELALAESLTNAIRHGNRLDETKQVFVECKLSPERFWIRVCDEGEGFEPLLVPDCTADENLECSGGRGLALIKAFMSHVEHNKSGNCVTMEKIRSGEACNQNHCRPCDAGDSGAK